MSDPGPAVQNPGLGNGSTQPNCWQASDSFQVDVVSDDVSGFINASSVFPGDQFVTVTPTHTNGVNQAKIIPPNVGEITFTMNASGTFPGAILSWVVYDSTGTHAVVFQNLADWSNINTPLSFSLQRTLPTTAYSWFLEIYPYWAPGAPQGSTWQVSIEVTYVCTGTGTNTPTMPCCPPDASTQIQLNQILQLLLNLSTQVPQTLPIGYTRGTVHQNISGTGSLTVNGLFGMLAELTSGVPTVPQLPGVPPYQFSVGWMSVLTGDGMIDEIRFTRQAQVWAPALMPLATTFGYQLNDGFTATFTELVPSASAAGGLQSSAILGV